MGDGFESVDGFFDYGWYLAQNPDVANDVGSAEAGCLAHFMRIGWREGRWPNPYFDPNWYLGVNHDVRDADQNALLHYILYGEAEGRRPVPAFDPEWYRHHHGLDRSTSPLRHFLQHRNDGTASPVPGFDADWYLHRYPDVAASGRDLYAHFCDVGMAEGRTPRPDVVVIRESGLFDASHYLVSGPDVPECRLDPLAHFCSCGYREGRRPNAYFNPRWYYTKYLSKQGTSINPLTYFVLYGESLDHRPVAYFDTGWYRRTYGISSEDSALRHYLAHRRTQTVSPTPYFDLAFFLHRYGTLVGPNRDPFAFYLQQGCTADLDPSPNFDAASYRKRYMGRPRWHFSQILTLEDRNPLVHCLLNWPTRLT